MKLKSLLSMFAPPSYRKRSAGLTAVVAVDDGVAIAHMVERTNGSELTHCEFIKTASPQNDIKLLRERIDALGLTGSHAVGLLNEEAYQLLLVDAPDVPAEEMAEALRWRVKDLVGFDVDEALIDYVELPSDAYRGRSKMVYAVVADAALVDKETAWLLELGLKPKVIDIPELALLNATQRLASDARGVAIFNLGSPSSTVSLISDQALYFTRTLSYDAKVAAQQPHIHADSAVLELQRSLDYYESQVGKPPCAKLYVLPIQEDETSLLNALRASLPLDVRFFDFTKVISSKVDLTPGLQKSCLMAIVAALRPMSNSAPEKERKNA
ncbi:MAG: pilus assembly protein PilM [Pontibacterium sp.]